MSRVFLSMTEEEVSALDVAREKVGMTKSQYVRYLMSGKKEIRPPTIRYKELIHRLDAIERDLKVIAMKESLTDTDRICIMAKLEDIKNLLRGKFMGGKE